MLRARVESLLDEELRQLTALSGGCVADVFLAETCSGDRVVVASPAQIVCSAKCTARPSPSSAR